MNDAAHVAEKPNYFFYANEGPASEKPPLRPQHKKTGSFVYADGKSEGSTQPVVNGARQQDTSNKLSSIIHSRQNSVPQAQAGSSVKAPSITIPAPGQQQRQPSPPRSGFHLTYRKGASQVIPPQPLSPTIPDYDPSRRRKSSIDDDIDSKRQSRAFSVSSVASGEHLLRKDNAFPFLSMFSLPSSKNSPIVSPVADTSLRSSGDRDIIQALDAETDHPQSPPSAVGSSNSDPHRAEAAAHARRERKIMDLEISNSSLLVINRSLEKEVRRQKAELRRARRLSRKTSMEAMRVSSGRLSLLAEEDEEEEQAESLEEESEETESETDSFADEPMSPSAITQRDVRHRKHDQIRLKKDLAKHKELLADSQKMNQSLKKCMSITESLIQEGNKALAYKVDHEEVRLGGRILYDDEINGDMPSSRPETPFENTDHLGDPSPANDTTNAQSEALAALESAIDGMLPENDINGVRQGSYQSPKAMGKLTKTSRSSELLGETF